MPEDESPQPTEPAEMTDKNDQKDDGFAGKTKRRRSSLLLGLAIGLVLLLVSTGCAAYAGYRYEQSHAHHVLPGVSVSGIDIGGMTRTQAQRVLEPSLSEILDRPLRIRAANLKWVRTARQLGVRATVDRALDRALGISDEFGWTSRLVHRLLNRPVGEQFDMAVSMKTTPVDGFVQNVADRVFVRPRNAALDLQAGEVIKRRSKDGRELITTAARRAILGALQHGRSSVKLRFRTIAPVITEESLGKTIIIRLSENRLYLYEGLDLVKSYTVATGQSKFPTPQGHFSIINKRINPTWINPAKKTWGKDAPDFIPPGPDNPLGTRALDLDAPGIRIHGTPDDASIGHYASHGCIRMHISDSEELFGQVGVGTRVVIGW